jgi:hypothetical protein
LELKLLAEAGEEIYSFQRDVVDKDHHSIFYVVSYKRASIHPSSSRLEDQRREKEQHYGELSSARRPHN